MRRRRWFARVVVVVCSVAALGLGARSAGRGRAPETRPARMVLARAGLGREDTFVSLVPACGCARRTELEAFSTITGRLTRRLGSVKISPVAAVDAPAVQAGGRLLITVSTGWRCAARGSYAECPRIKPDSCTNEVLKDIPAQGGPQVAFTIPGRFEINDAVPSPNGRLIAFAQTPCTSENGPTGLFVRGSTAARHRRLLFGRRNACDSVDRPGWDSSGGRLVFVYDHANFAPTRGPVGGVRGCPPARNEIVVTGTGSHPGTNRIADDRGCAYAAAAFDRQGVLAVEGCKRGSRPGIVSTGDGDAYLVQLSNTGQHLRRWRLKRGLEQALITPEPGTSRLLITQDLPANNDEPEADWVWELNGTRLRLVNHYHANDAAQVLAVGW